MVQGTVQTGHYALQYTKNTLQMYQMLLKLEIWGRAQLEATQHPKSNRKYNLVASRACKNLRG